MPPLNNVFTTQDIRLMRSDGFHNKTYVDIRTGTQSFNDGVPTQSWVSKERRVMDLAPIDIKEERLVVEVGGEKFVVDYEGFMDLEADVIIGNRLTPNSGTTEYQVLSVNSYDDHKEMFLKEVRN